MKRFQSLIPILIAILVPSCGLETSNQSNFINEIEENYSELIEYNYTPAIILATEPDKITVFGDAKPDSIVGVGSITKTFTSLILAQMVIEGKLKLDDPVNKYLPLNFSDQITLLNLATHTSGIPTIPDDLYLTENIDIYNPYPSYSKERLFKYLNSLDLKPLEEVQYSNIGYTLLGMILEKVSGKTYSELLKEYITIPLNLPDTTAELSPSQKERQLPGYMGGIPCLELTPVCYETGIFVADRAVYSTASDLLKFAQLENQKNNPLAQAMELTRSFSVPYSEDYQYSLGLVTNGTIIGHDGGWAGYASYWGTNFKNGKSIVVLSNNYSFDSSNYSYEMIDLAIGYLKE